MENEKDFEIEIQEETEEVAEGVQLPVNYLTFGEIAPNDVHVYIRQGVYRALEKLAASDTSKELGSILLGDYCEVNGNTHVIITNCIEAKYTDASSATLTFTHETWEYVHSRHEKKYADKKIIGWQHTHPNYGIFLSNYDMFIQENFFNLPFQIAYVIDPVQNLRGFFQWKDGKVEKLQGYNIYDEVGKPIKIEQTKVKKEEEKTQAKPSKVMTVLVALLCAATVFLSFFAASLNKDYQKQLKRQDEILKVVAAMQAEINDQNALIDQLTGDSGVETDDGTVKFKTYTVVAGDTLSKICKKQGLSYKANAKIILAINGIKDADHIYVGQKLLLPVIE